MGGGKMGGSFQIPPAGTGNQIVGNVDYSNEMKALGTSLDLMKVRASDVFTAYKHSLSATHSSTSSFDPETAHMLEELSEEYAEDGQLQCHGSPPFRQDADVSQAKTGCSTPR